MEIYNNSITKADDEFINKVLKFFQKNSNKSFTDMEVKKKTGLTRTAVVLSINELFSKNILEKKVENQKNYFKYKGGE